MVELETRKCSRISVHINNNGSLTVEDDGSGISVATHPSGKMTILEWVMRFSAGAEIHLGERRFLYRDHSVGVRAVTALSEWSEVTVTFDGRFVPTTLRAW